MTPIPLTTAIVVSGLPASGKSKIARALAARLSFDLFDKDDFLESLFDKNLVATLEDRRRLSRMSDVRFQSAASLSDAAILVSHWRSMAAGAGSGTPLDWVAEHFSNVIELYCNCDPTVATARFLSRQRHPGHLDSHQDPAEWQAQMIKLASALPLNCGSIIEIRTDQSIDAEAVADAVSVHLEKNAAAP